MQEDLTRSELPDLEAIDGACDAASDLTARLLADLHQAEATLAVADARAYAAISTGHPVPPDVRNERILRRREVDVIRQVMDGMPTIQEEHHVASA